MKTCSKCGQSKSLEAFPRECKRGKLVHRATCANCRKSYDSLRQKRRHEQITEMFRVYKAKPCLDCQMAYPPYVMDLDHRDPSLKSLEFCEGKRSSVIVLREELAKCDVVCANCHRLRSWVPAGEPGRKRQLLRDLKSRACSDCGQNYHYSQMDFDHTRGTKIGSVSRLSGVSLGKLLEEVQKCDVVCANCHRERTHQRSMGITILTQTTWPVFKLYPWQELVGTMADQAVAAAAGIPIKEVYTYRVVHCIPVFRRQTSLVEATI